MKTFKHFLFSVIIVFVLVNAGWGQVTLPHYDGLNYTVGQGLQTQTGWTTLNTGDDLLIAAGNLSYTGLPASTGNKVTFSSSGIDAAKLFTQQTSGTVYYSFLLNITGLGSLNTTGSYFTGFTEGASTTFGATVWLRSDGVGYDIGINPRTTAANTVWSTGTTNINTTLFIVISYQIVSGTTNDVVKLWINPDPNSPEPAATLSATNGLTDLANVNRILIRQDAATTTPFVEMDELRFSTTWGESVLPVSFASFVSIVSNRNVNLNWITDLEINNSGFDVERSVISNQLSDYSKIGFVEGQGTKNTPTSYSFEDKNLNSGKYKYRLKQVDVNGNYEYFELNGEVEIGVPKKYDISQNYPNPFNPVTKINFDLPENGLVNIRLYDMLGREVAVIVNEVRNAGYHTVQFDASKLSSGVYFYKMNAGKFNGIKKMAVVK